MLTEQDVFNEIKRCPGLNKATLAKQLGVKPGFINTRLNKLQGQVVFKKGPSRGETLIYEKDYANANGITPDQPEGPSEVYQLARKLDELMPVPEIHKRTQ